MPCTTPSQPDPLPPGESIGIEALLRLTKGQLGKESTSVKEDEVVVWPDLDKPDLPINVDLRSTAHYDALKAQNSSEGDLARAWLDARNRIASSKKKRSQR